MRRILITGSREFEDVDVVLRAIEDAQLDETGTAHECIVVHGAAPGADSIAAEIAYVSSTLTAEAHPADWVQHGRRAGFLRNYEMVKLGADVCLAFFKKDAGNKGTSMTANLARKAGIPVKEYWA